MPDGCAIVTGSARGIGAATASALAAEGWPVVVNYRSDADSAEALATSIEADGGRAVAVAADVTDQHDVPAASKRFVPPPDPAARVGRAIETDQLESLRADRVVLGEKSALHRAGELEIALDHGQATFAFGP